MGVVDADLIADGPICGAAKQESHGARRLSLQLKAHICVDCFVQRKRLHCAHAPHSTVCMVETRRVLRWGIQRTQVLSRCTIYASLGAWRAGIRCACARLAVGLRTPFCGVGEWGMVSPSHVAFALLLIWTGTWGIGCRRTLLANRTRRSANSWRIFACRAFRALVRVRSRCYFILAGQTLCANSTIGSRGSSVASAGCAVATSCWSVGVCCACLAYI